MQFGSRTRLLVLLFAFSAPMIAVSFAGCSGGEDDVSGAATTTGHGGGATTTSSSTKATTASSSTISSGGGGSSSSAGGSGGHGGVGGQGGSGGAIGGGGSSSSASGGSGGDAGPDATDDGGGDASVFDAGDDGSCNMPLSTFPLDPAPHVPECTYVAYSTNPPTSGPHYPVWAEYQQYATPVPRGFWVHDMEHGGIVFTYNCPQGCASEVAQVAAVFDAYPADPGCVAPDRIRRTITPDPYLDTKFAISAWGAYIKADCIDLNQIYAFISTYYAQGPENFCSDLFFDPTSPDAGLPPGCGDPPTGDASTD